MSRRTDREHRGGGCDSRRAVLGFRSQSKRTRSRIPHFTHCGFSHYSLWRWPGAPNRADSGRRLRQQGAADGTDESCTVEIAGTQLLSSIKQNGLGYCSKFVHCASPDRTVNVERMRYRRGIVPWSRLRDANSGSAKIVGARGRRASLSALDERCDDSSTFAIRRSCECAVPHLL
jgi:hypothetical protein